MYLGRRTVCATSGEPRSNFQEEDQVRQPNHNMRMMSYFLRKVVRGKLTCGQKPCHSNPGSKANRKNLQNDYTYDDCEVALVKEVGLFLDIGNMSTEKDGVEICNRPEHEYEKGAEKKEDGDCGGEQDRAAELEDA